VLAGRPETDGRLAAVGAGGRYYLQMPDGFAAAGTFRVVEPPGRLEFSWGWAPGAGAKVLDTPQPDSLLPPGASTVTVTVRADGDSTVVDLEHHGLPSSLRDAHQVAWHTYLPRLVVAASGGDPGPDPHS
jgi:uncharacterized protein YndB with AHSA1/START domain